MYTGPGGQNAISRVAGRPVPRLASGPAPAVRHHPLLFGPGDARLVEDTTGQGHTTRVRGNRPGVTATIPLAQQ
jgi:hypothetical protein